jgi:maltose/maltodextrin transport system substrate-binding protein
MLFLVLASCAPQRHAPTRPAAWNQHAIQFIWPPGFDVHEVEGAKTYLFEAGAADGRAYSFRSREARSDLTPIWGKLPVGPVSLRVSGLDDSGRVMRVATTRAFHRAAPFNGPYGKPVLAYGESARVALESLMHEPFVQSWRTTGKPDPSYPLYRYAAKMMGSLAGGCSLYAQQTPRPTDADEAIAIGRAAADYLIAISSPAGSPLEFFPPTYHDAKPTERENDAWTMMMTPAEAAQGYLDFYDVTRDEKYLNAARRIAGTYAKCQWQSGTWPLKVDKRTGEPIADVELIPSEVIRLLDRLVNQYQSREYQPTLDRAVAWMMANPVRTFDWRAQFDDAKVRGPYENLSKHEACQFAAYLFMRSKNDASRLAIAEDLLRFAEDQFVVWENPPRARGRSEQLAPEHWITPCSCEQYAMFEPVSGSSAWMIVAYLRAYEATGQKLYLRKAQSLGNALTLAQQRHNGRYPTRMIERDLAYWLNSTVNSARAMQLLAWVP